MNKGSLLSGIFIAAFLAGAGFFGLANLLPAKAEAEPISLRNAVNGKWALGYEMAFNENIDIYEPSVDTWGLLNYLIFKEGREGVLVGEDGWLFTNEEFTQPPEQEQEIEEKLQFIKDTYATLAAKNVRMVVALVPSKARLYQENLGRYQYPAYQSPVYNQSQQELEKSGIPVVDLYQAMKNRSDLEKLFLKTDTHWTPIGAQVAANAIAAEVRKEWPGLIKKKENYETVAGAPVPHQGDLLRYLPLGALADDLGLPPDSLLSVETRKISESAGTDSGADALFGEENLPVALIGTSYSANPQWNFDGYLKEALQTDILNAADEGRGPFETMKDYLEDESFRNNPPELIVWEIPERYLSISYEEGLKKT